MTNSQITQTPQSEGIPGCLLNGLVATKAETESESFEAWIAILTKLAEEQERSSREQSARTVREARIDDGQRLFREIPAREVPGREIKEPMEKLPEGPWRSLGGYFDYSLWPERERFLELDRIIASGHDVREAEVDRDGGMF